MNLPFTQTLRDHSRVINWNNFNVAVFQGIGKPKERERGGEMASQWSNQNTHIYQLSSTSYMGDKNVFELDKGSGCTTL